MTDPMRTSLCISESPTPRASTTAVYPESDQSRGGKCRVEPGAGDKHQTQPPSEEHGGSGAGAPVCLVGWVFGTRVLLGSCVSQQNEYVFKKGVHSVGLHNTV